MGVNFLAEKKLRRLRELTGLELNGAWRAGPRECEGRTVENGRCRHWRIDPHTGSHEELGHPTHWASCPPRDGEDWTPHTDEGAHYTEVCEAVDFGFPYVGSA